MRTVQILLRGKKYKKRKRKRKKRKKVKIWTIMKKWKKLGYQI